MTVQRIQRRRTIEYDYQCLSSDIKPTSAVGVQDGDPLHEVDTGRKYIYHEGQWIEDLRPHVRNFVWDTESLGWVAMTGTSGQGMMTADLATQELLYAVSKQLEIMNMHLAVITGNNITKMEVD